MNKKIKKIIPVILSALMCGSFTLAACGHTHEWEWKSENGQHWQECKGCDAKTGKENHIDPDDNLICDVCGDTLTPASKPVQSVAITGADSVTVGGDTITLTATITPSDATNTNVTWSSSDQTKATVSSTGVVTAVAAGEVTITVTTADGNKTATKTITVNPAQQQTTPLESIEITGEGEVTVGSSITLTANKTPETATETITWSSSETTKATVNASTGEVTGVAEGTVTITATSSNNKTATKLISVTPAQSGLTSTPLPADKKIYVVGDSTVCSFSDNYYLPRYGYGTQLAEYLNVTSNQVVNLALSGRSSKSFTYDLSVDSNNKNSISGSLSCYQYLTQNISAGDYLIIGFGHNDEKSDNPERFTSPVGDYTTAGSFQKSLYDNYVKMAKDKQATPILCTPITRYDASGNYTGDKVHNTAAGDYAKAIRDLGAATDTTVIDLTALTIAEYKKDNAEAQYYHAFPSYVSAEDKTPTGRDDTHINKYGAKMVAYQFANALKATNSTLKAHIKENISAPTKAVDYAAAIKADYVKPDYTVFNPANNSGNRLTEGWYKTVMGDLGGGDTGPFKVLFENDTFTVDTTKKKGKITGTKDGVTGVDGFAAAFMQIDKNKNFTASATVKVLSLSDTDASSGTTYAADNQSAFGMMLRDDIYVNKNTKNDGLVLDSNYVAAGAFAKSNGAIFSRKDKELVYEKKSLTPTVNAEYEISITKLGQDVTVKFGTYQVTYGDLDFTSVDNDYVYLCLFATRSIKVQFTNLQFEVTGDSQGA